MCKEKGKEGVESLVVSGDVGKEENVKVLFGKIKEVYGRLDLLFNVCGKFCPCVRGRRSQELKQLGRHFYVNSERWNFRKSNANRRPQHR